ncbi:MAG TPA: MgtC/SapB family protein [Aestuariivirgaceae bacterium]|nr:MgtC/SapB family protein [Aestuariivirgaceae bacterium]
MATFLGAVIGFDRELKRRPAGLRTHMVLSLAAALFTVLTLELYAELGAQTKSGADPIRIIEAITVGVSFLAAGTIIRSGGHVEGLTTGAGMWLAGAVGLACGLERTLRSGGAGCDSCGDYSCAPDTCRILDIAHV